MPRRYLLFLLLSCAGLARAADLTLDLGGNAPEVWTTQRLLARADARTVTIESDVVFHRTMQYRAVPLAALLRGLPSESRLQFVASDGFAVDLDQALIDNVKGAQAWLAVEDPARPWPALPGGKGQAGPFYVVWVHPAAAGVGTEQWPYQVAAIKLTREFAARFPATAPAADLPADSPVRHGYAVFQRTCAACHSLNGQGDAHMGPDLNVPHSPTEYFGVQWLRAFVRDPQSVRRWPESKMTGFPTQDALSDADLNAVIAYLQHMAERKAAHATK